MMMTSSPLFQPVRLGALELPHRVLMAPLTRSRSAQPGNAPHALNAEYYAQRAGAGLIISEATQISPEGQGYAWTPGIHSAEQIEGWRGVTRAVHAKGGRIFLQLWHVGRVSHPLLQPHRGLPVAPSAIAPSGTAFVVDETGAPAFVPFVTPRALETHEIPRIVADFAQAAAHARAAGFDGVEIHSANGYLLDQFLNSSANHRTDAYGGSIENRARLTFEVLQAVSRVLGPGRVGVRFSPFGRFMDMGDSNPLALYAHIAERLNDLDLAYAHVVDPAIIGNETAGPIALGAALLQQFRATYRGKMVLAGGFDRAKAEEAIGSGLADAIAFGRSFLANPDLPERLRANAPLNAPNKATFYGGGAEGYTDYPAMAG